MSLLNQTAEKKPYGRKDPVKIRLMDLVVLLYNTFRANERRDIGFEDANQTIMELVRSLNKEISVERKDAESMLWSCGLLNEKADFWHPQGLFYTSFIKTVFKRHRVDPVIFSIDDKEKVKVTEDE